MKTKICTGCQQTKPLSEYHKHKPSKDGLKPRCKTCQRTAEAARRFEPDHKAVQAWHDLNKRVLNQSEYAHVQVLVSRSDFIAWATEAYRDWLNKRPSDRPSVDREDPEGHYEIGNLRLIALGDNSRRTRAHKNVNAPAGQAWCGRCRAYRSVQNFAKNTSKPHGLQNHCRDCRATSRAGRT